MRNFLGIVKRPSDVGIRHHDGREALPEPDKVRPRALQRQEQGEEEPLRVPRLWHRTQGLVNGRISNFGDLNHEVSDDSSSDS